MHIDLLFCNLANLNYSSKFFHKFHQIFYTVILFESKFYFLFSSLNAFCFFSLPYQCFCSYVSFPVNVFCFYVLFYGCHWLELPIQCWMGVVKVNTLTFFPDYWWNTMLAVDFFIDSLYSVEGVPFYYQFAYIYVLFFKIINGCWICQTCFLY